MASKEGAPFHICYWALWGIQKPIEQIFQKKCSQSKFQNKFFASVAEHFETQKYFAATFAEGLHIFTWENTKYSFISHTLHIIFHTQKEIISKINKFIRTFKDVNQMIYFASYWRDLQQIKLWRDQCQ